MISGGSAGNRNGSVSVGRTGAPRSRRGTLTTPTARGCSVPTAARSVPTGGLKSSAQRTGFRSLAGTESKARSKAGSTPATRADTTLPSGRRHVGWPGNSLALVMTHPFGADDSAKTDGNSRVQHNYNARASRLHDRLVPSQRCGAVGVVRRLEASAPGQFPVDSEAFLAVVRGDLSTAHRVKQRVDELASRHAE